MADEVVITRDTRGETVNGKSRAERVFVTGPHHGRVWSSTEDPDRATRFPRVIAEDLLALGKWRHHTPRIEEVPR